jgi:hypothetical protein
MPPARVRIIAPSVARAIPSGAPDATGIGSLSSVHGRFREGTAAGDFVVLRAPGLEESDEWKVRIGHRRGNDQGPARQESDRSGQAEDGGAAAEFGKEDSNLHRPVQSRRACRLADSRGRPAGVEPACLPWGDSAWPLGQGRIVAEGAGVEPARAGRPPGFRPGAVATSAGPSPRIEEPTSSGGRNRTRVLPVNNRALVPARAPPESHRRAVGMAGFEPAFSCSRSRRIHQAFPHPEPDRSEPNRSAQRESNPHFRRGGAVGSHYIMGTIDGANRAGPNQPEHRVGLEPTSPQYGCGVLAAGRPVPEERPRGSGTRGTRTLTRLVKSQMLCLSSYGPVSWRCDPRSSRPGRSRTSVARLSAECSPVELRAEDRCVSSWRWGRGDSNPRLPA